MTITETNFGVIVKWGYNCEDGLRDLRKLNDGFSSHHPKYEDFCKESDFWYGKCISLVSRMDQICREQEGRAWSEEAAEEYNTLSDEFDHARESLDDVCSRYADESHIYGYSWCF